MTTETIETPAQQVDPEPQAVETEAPATEVVAEGAAPEPEAAAAPEQVTITEPEKPEYMTRADWEREKSEVARNAAAEALDLDKRRRQTEGARRAQQEKRDTDDKAELIDTVKAAFGAQGIYEVPDEVVIKAVDRAVRKRTEQLASTSLDTVDQAWDYLTAPAYGKNVDLDEAAEGAAKRLGPKVQHLVNQIRPAIEAAAREGYIPVSELDAKVKAGVEAALAARAANGRAGEEELKRVDGTAPTTGNTLASWETRVAHQGEAGYSMMTDADWNTYRQIRQDNGL